MYTLGVTSSELLLLFSLVSLVPIVLFANQTFQALKGTERVGVESRWGGIGGGGGGWGLTRPATWAALTVFFALLTMVLITQLASRAQQQQERRDAQVLAISRLALEDHQAALEALKAASTDAERAAAALLVERSLSLHESAVALLEAQWKPTSEAPATTSSTNTTSTTNNTNSTAPASKTETIIAIPAREPTGSSQPDSDSAAPLRLAESAPLASVISDLKRYVRGEISGTSFLVSGHRGSGKTTLVHGAIEEVMRWSMRQGLTRPLVVRINGPDLFTPDTTDGAEPLHVRVLQELAKALARAVRDEFIASLHRHTDRSRGTLGDAEFQRYRQMIVQLQLTLGGVVTLAEMEGLWRDMGLMTSGCILTRDSRLGGGEEIFTLWQTQEVYHQIAGKRTVTDKIDEKNQRERVAKTSLSVTLDKLVPSLWALLTGALAGVGLRLANEEPLVAAAGALVTALVASLTLNISSLRSFSITRRREYSFEPESGPRALPRLLSELVERLQRIGLAPVFVIDELDKIDGLDDGMHALIRQLKSFISEQACFFFLTEPGYFERRAQESELGAYPEAHTYFARRVFVSYTPADLRRWLDQLLPLAQLELADADILPQLQQVYRAVVGEAPAMEMPEGLPVAELVQHLVEAAEPAERVRLSERIDDELSGLRQRHQLSTRHALDAWKYLMLYRSRLHFGDLTRLLRKLQDGSGNIPIPVAPSDREFARILAQVALEQAMVSVLGEQPGRRWHQIALDALYHPLARWEVGELTLDASEAGARTWAAKQALSDSAVSIVHRLRAHMADLLAHPESLQRTPGISSYISRFDAILEPTGEGRYRWCVTPDGRPIRPAVSVASASEDASSARARTQQYIEGLSAWPGLSAEMVFEQLGLLPRRPGWLEVETALTAAAPSAREHAVLTRFDQHLSERHRLLSLALTWAAVLDPLQQTSDFARVLSVMSLAYRFDEHTVEELEERLRLPLLKLQGFFPDEAVWEAVAEKIDQGAPLSALAPPVMALRQELQVWLDSLADFSVEADLWREQRDRIERHLAGKEPDPPSMSWVVSRLQRREASWMIRLNPADMSIREWSRAFLHGRNDEGVGWLASSSLRALRAQANVRDVVLVVRWKNRRVGSEPPGRWPALVLELDEEIPAGALAELPIRRWMMEVSAEESLLSIDTRRGRLVKQLGIKAQLALFADVRQPPKGWEKMLLMSPLLMNPDSVTEAMEQWERVAAHMKR